MHPRTFGVFLAALAFALTSCGTKKQAPPRYGTSFLDAPYTGYSAAPQRPTAPPPRAVAVTRSLPATEPVSARGQYIYPSDAPGVLASSYILIDSRSGDVIAQKNADQRRAVASTQKLVTALLILERGNLDGTIVIRPEDTKAPPSKMYLKAGQRITRRELLRVFLVKSANDAAEALARDHSGSLPAFAAAMNAKARQLGAYDSNFKNPHGLTESGQYSTARDIARIAFVAYRNSFIRDTAKLQSVYVAGKTYKSTNKLLARMPECTGLKTGYTEASGRCLVSTAEFQGRDTLLVQLGSKTANIFTDAETLMRWGNRQSGGFFAVQ